MTERQRSRFIIKARNGLLTGAVVALLVLMLWQANWFVSLRLRLSNNYYVEQPTLGNIVLVAMDDATLTEFGSPLVWSRQRYADLLDVLTDGGAQVVTFDVLFSEARDAEGDAAFAESIEAARAAGVRTVLAASGRGRMASDDGQIQFTGELAPIALFADVADYVAYVNAYPDADGVIRRDMARGAANDIERLSLGVASYLSYFNMSSTLAAQVVTYTETTLQLPPDLTVPLDDDGFWRQNYFGRESRVADTFAVYSFRDVVNGEIDPTVFADKIVMVGLMNTTGAVDNYPTPMSRSGEMMAGVEIQANAIETLLAKIPLQEESQTAQIISFLVVALWVGLLGGVLRWYWTIAASVMVFLLWMVYASLRFSLTQTVVNPLHPNLALIFTTVGSVGVQLSIEIIRRQRVENLLQSLVQVSQQRMELDRIVPLIAQDLQSMTQAPHGALWFDTPDSGLTLRHTWGDGQSYDDVTQSAAQQLATVQADGAMAVPVVWQGQTLAVFTLSRDSKRPFGRVIRRQVERFAERLGANLDNALLYAQTQRQYQLVEGILSGSPAGILVFDSAFNLLHCNDAASEALQVEQAVTLDAMLDASCMAAADAEKLRDKLQQETDFRQEVKLDKKTYQVDALLMGDNRWIMTLGDISDLAELNQLKTRMIRMASHDLKNPLGRVVGYSEMIIDMDEGNLDDRSKLFLNRILQSAEEMKGIINEILDLEHVKSGQVTLEPMSMTNIVRNVIERHNADMSEKGQTFHADIAPDLPMIAGNYNLLMQAVSNLLGNASKYTPENGEITLRLYHQADSNTLRLDIQDNGYGMPEEAQAKLFTEFYRVRTEKTRDIKGTGLGLSLVKSVIDAHNGTIWVTSELDKGSTFSVELPVLSVS